MPPTLTKNERKEVKKVQLSVDFPKQNEVVASPQYTLRVSAPGFVNKVDVSIDDGDWQACRHSVGYWWYDWSGYDGGEHEVVARAETQEGRRITSEPHEFFVTAQAKAIKA